MNLRSRTRLSVVTASAVLLTTAIVFAQNAPATKRQEPKRQDADQQDANQQDAKRSESKRPKVVTTKKVPGQASRGDSQIAACLIIDNNNEIALGQLAAQRSQNAEVKDFAQRIIQDHQQLVSQLEPIASAGGYDLARPAGSERGSADKNDSRRKQRGDADTPVRKGREKEDKSSADADSTERAEGATERKGSEQGLDFVRIRQEIAEKCLQSARLALEEKSAAKFDKCYITGQIMAHTAMVDALEVLKNHATGELTSIIEDGLKTSQAHLDDAKRLEKSLENAAQK